MTAPIEVWQRLADREMEPLVEAAAHMDAADVAAVSRLRRSYPSELVGAALDLAAARRKLALKWPHHASRMWADPAGAEMATSALAADHKAARFRRAGARVGLDLCCGIGADAIGLQQAGLAVTAVDIDPIRTWMTGLNTACRTITADVTDMGDLLSQGDVFHLDPARRATVRGTPRRLVAIDDLLPGPATWRDIINHSAASRTGEPRRVCGAIKLGPGVDYAEVAAALGDRVELELEYLSEDGRMTQAVAWLGGLAGPDGGSFEPELVRATMLRSGRPRDSGAAPVTLAGLSGVPPVISDISAARYILEADPAAERARLLGTLCQHAGAAELAPGLGLLGSEHASTSAWFTSFEVLHHEPWSQRRIQAWLRGNSCSVVEVKTRAGVVNPDLLQPALCGDGHTPFTLFVLRLGSALHAWITRRVPPVSESEGDALTASL